MSNMQNMTFPPVYQYAAGLAWRAAKGSETKALTAFCKQLKAARYELPTNPLEYLKTWGPRLGGNGLIEGYAWHSGRPRSLTDAQVTECYVEAVNWWLAGRQGPYTSAQELITENAVVHNIVEAADITPETLTKNLKEFDPRFKYGTVRDKPYRVSSVGEQLGALLLSNMLHCLMHSCCPASGAALHIICSTRAQQQHTETVSQRCIRQCLILCLPIC